MDTWARNTVRRYWSADTLFWQLSIDHNIDVQSASSWPPKVVRKCESKHWFSFCEDGRRSVGRCTVTWLANFLGWVDLLSYKVPDTVIIIQLNRRFSHVPHLIREVTALRWRSESTKFDSFKLNTTLLNLRLKQSKILLRFKIWFRSRISHVSNIMHLLIIETLAHIG